MKIRKLYMALVGILMSTQLANAQQNMLLVGNNGEINAISVSSVDYATFNANDKLFTITNDGLEGLESSYIKFGCTVALSSESNVKTLSVTPEVGVCYSKFNKVPTIDDDYVKLGSELKSYMVFLRTLASGTTYYYRTYVKLASDVYYGEVANATTYGTPPTNNNKTVNGHWFIDLGLPSGLLWAETNVGAPTAADAGNYYAWGETEPQSSNNYYWDSYKYGPDFHNLTKYNSSDQKTTLEKEDDAAAVNWGGSCRMPTNDEFSELLNSSNCTWTWTSKTAIDGSSVNGYLITSVKNGNSIFLPAAGCRYDGKFDGSVCYWSSTLSSNGIHYAYLLYSGPCQTFNFRFFGNPVRAVSKP